MRNDHDKLTYPGNILIAGHIWCQYFAVSPNTREHPIWMCILGSFLRNILVNVPHTYHVNDIPKECGSHIMWGTEVRILDSSSMKTRRVQVVNANNCPTVVKYFKYIWVSRMVVMIACHVFVYKGSCTYLLHNWVVSRQWWNMHHQQTDPRTWCI
jgi:hypothetical protein